MSIGVIGLGRVGRATVAMYERAGHAVVGWDLTSDHPYPADEFARSDYAVICVGTPQGPRGEADVSAVENAVYRVPVGRVVLKSTVPPGTTDRLARETGKEICFWPEYVGESRYYNPYFPDGLEEVPFVIIGGEPAVRSWFIDQTIRILGPTKKYHQCSAIEAELIKYAENTFFATKITFANELRRICEAFAADWHTVREGWVLDPRVGPMHTAAFDDQPGFGGKCLPKDLAGIIAASLAAGYDPRLLREVSASNHRFRVNEPVEPVTDGSYAVATSQAAS